MIRTAEPEDIPAIVGMVERLRASVKSPLEVDQAVTRRFVAGLLASPLGAVWVMDGADGPTGFLAASVGTASISMLPVAVEHGWWAEQGGGLLLLVAYERWAVDMGCKFIRMSTPAIAGKAADILAKFGYEPAELAWVKPA